MDNTKLTAKFLEAIKPGVSAANFKTFFAKSELELVDDQQVVVFVPTAFAKATLLQRHLPLLEKTAQTLIDKKVAVEITVRPNLNQLPADEDLFAPQVSKSAFSLNPKYTLENFVVGPSNNVAYAAAQAVAQNPGTSYNPLFIYGGTGVGKTHLMLGIGNAISKKRVSNGVIYCSSEKFMNDYVSAIQNRKMIDLRARYRSAYILLIDDIQFFSGRDGTQEEFFHTFNDLQAKNSQMIITSDRPPGQIEKLEDRLRSRFAGGLMVDIQPPDFDTRVAILKAKCSQWGNALPEDTLKLIASSSQLSIRELEGKLLQILQTLKARNLTPAAENIASFLNTSVQKRPSLTYKEVFLSVCQYFNIKNSDLTGPRRQKELVLPRHLTMYIMSEELGMTVEKIGQLLGGRDHTTVMHARDKIRQLINKDREVQRMFIEVKQALSTLS
ncbi:chromosomal replication initiator protein DnaA [Candidatus Daviesbacteria bacterium RIFCSPLOWO2_01_FULL_39_12]|uniref:Chromosomal replication initiator protein DnaA n=1 Tax=Candidatus Daviesbacteria bacterium RIFCSPLOWO2_01_FULL_39_12 TaxID=1797785 RepID=A0A1F5KSV0_9BACT|nr:MAG: chromosomal replication initiator protein DnaA [Candidatus Daviesbacteria bacterium RIFCSPLOWO2_01_FULL_39_12]